MKRVIFSLFLFFSIGSSYAAELNVYASGLRFNSINPETHKASISYILNAPAETIEFQLLDEGSSIVRTIALNDPGHLTKGEHNNVEIDLFGIPSGNYTWAIKATADANTELAQVNDHTENRFNFYSPQGLVVDNHTNSPYFGRIYVAESRTATTGAGRGVKEGIYIFDALLTDVTNQSNASYAGGVSWNEDVTTTKDANGFLYALYGPARMSVDEDGYVYICDNGKSTAINTSGVWRMDPANPTNRFDCMLDVSKRENGGYTRVNSIAVTGSGENRTMYILDWSDNIVKFEIGNNTNVSNRDEIINTQTDGITTAVNTLVRGKEGDFWVFQYRQEANLDKPSVTHYNKNGERDFYINQTNNNSLTSVSYPNRRGNGAVSPDGKYLAFNCNNGLFIYTVTYDANGVPSLSNRQTITTHGTSQDVDAIAFDVAHNLYFASASTEYFYAFALPKLENNHTTPAPASESITIAEVVPHIMAYDLDVEQDGENYIFSFYSNSDATSGKLLFYDNTDTKIAEITINQSISKGNNTFSVHKSEMPKGENMAWKLQLTGADNEAFGIVYQESTPLTRAHAVIDNSPESNYFGRIYISNRGDVNDDTNKGYHIYDYDYSKVITNNLCGRTGFSISGRPTVDAEGYVYWTDYGDTYGGIYVMDPQTLNTSPFFDGNKESSGLWKNGSTEIGSSCSGASIYGSGASTKLFAMNEDGNTLPQNGCVIYDIGKSDGSTAHTWNKAPSKTIAITNNANKDFAIVGCTHGVWLSQSRAKGQNNEEAYSLMFYGNNGTMYYKSNTGIINGSYGAGLAVSADESKLAMVNGDGDILLFDIEWVTVSAQVYRPQITLHTTYRTPYKAISSMHFDHAGNLITMAGNVYEGTDHGAYDMRLVVFSTPTDDNTTIIPARKRLAITTKVTLQDTKNNREILEACSGKIKDATITRSLNAGMYNTLCLPFAVADLTGTCFEGAEILEYTSATIETFGNSRDICLNFEEVTSIEAGVPYLVEPVSDITTMEFSDVTISATTASAITHDGITFQGILHPTLLTANDKSILFLIANNELAWANVDANMNGMRAYFKINEPSLLSARTRAIIKNGANTATNIEPITHEVVGNSAQKVIYNNNLYIIRDNKVYTSQGVEVGFIK